ncbi:MULTISPECIES: hypothetical protein [unclassified Duganella]|uniref:hypothetical protein n=1 Tax=unclassified Duganella TaxID=2636909 RepID=UPI000E349112|nr:MULTISPECIES: hypothetical protein [unclassified Duganella]RFP12070.1 hypothetical protein D0T23_19100 [Duganella sp. BJB475]RFP29919.1 hypothetical protein D0T21_18880 [Duganella sp. BJB476]
MANHGLARAGPATYALIVKQVVPHSAPTRIPFYFFKAHTMPHPISYRSWRNAGGLILSASLLTACGGGGGSAVAPPPAPATASELQLSPAPSQLVAGAAPLVVNATLNGTGSVSWTLAAGGAGSLSAASGATVSYAPPPAGAVYRNTPVTITASSGGLSKSITLTLTPAPGLWLVAGAIGGSGNLDGKGDNVRFDGLADISGDAAGNVYLGGGRRLRMLTPDGTVSTIASDDSYDRGPMVSSPDGTTQYFIRILQYELHLYARKSDGGNKDYGVVSGPTKMAADNNNVYLLYSAPYAAIVRYGAGDGNTVLVAGDYRNRSYVDGPAGVARLDHPTEMLRDRDGNLLVIDDGSLRKVTPDGAISTLVRGQPQDVADDGSGAVLHGARSLTLDRDGNVLLMERPKKDGGYAIRKVSGTTVTTLYVESDPAPAPLESNQYYADEIGYPSPDKLLYATIDGRLIVGNRNTLRTVNPDGSRTPLAGLGLDTGAQGKDGQGAAASYHRPGRLAADRDGNVYSVELRWDTTGDKRYLDESSNRAVLRKTTPSGQVSTILDREMGLITGLAVDRSGRLYFSLKYDANVDRGGAVYRLDANGQTTLIAGAAGAAVPHDALLQVDGTGSAARFFIPEDLAIDADDNLYVTEPNITIGITNFQARLRKITPAGVVSTILAPPRSDDPPPLPGSANLAPDGLHYAVQDNTVVRSNADGSKTVVAGKSKVVGTRLGAPGDALLGKANSIVATGPGTFAIAVDGAILRLVLP